MMKAYNKHIKQKDYNKKWIRAKKRKIIKHTSL